MTLVEFADLKALLELEKTSIDDYPALALLSDSVSAAIESYLGRALDYGKRTEAVRVPESTSMIALRALPVKSVESVAFTTNGTDAQTLTSFSVVDYGVELWSAISGGAVSVVYKGGFTTVPDWLHRAALMQIAYEFQNKDHIGADYVSIEGGSISRPALSLLGEVKRMLDPHKHPARLFW